MLGTVKRIFVSYSKDDGADIADAIYRYYKKGGYIVFESSREIQGGERWMQRILDDIALCDLFLFFHLVYGENK